MSPRAGLDLTIIVKAAANRADQDGYDELTLASVAQELGVRSPSLYNHVGGLPELRVHVAVYSLIEFLRRLREAKGDNVGEEAILALGMGYIQFVRDHPGLYEMILRSKDLSDSRLSGYGEEIVQLVVGCLEPYHLDSEMAIHIVRAIRSLLHGFASLEQGGGFGIALDLNVSVRLGLRTLLAGIERPG
ncbi:TetR-like C-terminal domain-containing protein [Paenibacillus sp. GCM10023252]|uniref:TetR-like C-terminal domain-containing protein n=1 Tax=Paenibacillus sp. GCM10023252 TaxID=3252649 RepID=UPI003612414B